jgi:hypothetical protein
VVSSSEAEAFFKKEHARDDARVRTATSMRDIKRSLEKGGDDTLWAIFEHEDIGRVLLLQSHQDEVVGACLTLQGVGRYDRDIAGSILHKAAMEALSIWMGPERKWDYMTTPLDPLVRIYWAIVTNRVKLAKFLWTQSSYPFIAAFVGSYVYKHMGLALGQVTVKRRSRQRKKLADDWDHFAADMLDCLDLHSDVSHQHTSASEVHSGAAVFEEYVFFGKDQEALWEKDPDTIETEFGKLTAGQRQENESLRSALKITGSDEISEITRVDLAIIATNKVFMGHPATEHFLDGLWARPCSNGKFVDLVSQTSPRFKFYSNVCGYLIFLTIYTLVFAQFPFQSIGATKPPSGLEIVFWSWVFVFIVDEAFQAWDDFDSIFMYMKGSGNKQDVLINSCFVAAALCRFIGAFDNAEAYLACCAILCINLIFCSFRLLHMFSINRRMGQLLIIIIKILHTDVKAFLIFCAVVISGFEVSAYFFSWVLETKHKYGVFFYMFSQVGDGQLATTMQENLGLLDWEEVSMDYLLFSLGFQTVFFLLTVVIMMNLLIAMMNHTFTAVNNQVRRRAPAASQEHSREQAARAG